MKGKSSFGYGLEARDDACEGEVYMRRGDALGLSVGREIYMLGKVMDFVFSLVGIAISICWLMRVLSECSYGT